MIAFIDDHREAHGVEPICKVLPIAPSTYRAQAARRRDPTKGSARTRRDAALSEKIRRVYDENFQVYGVRKVWRQMSREGENVARCTVARLMRAMGLQGVVRGKSVKTTVSDRTAACPQDKVNRQFQAPRPNALWVSDFTYVATWQGFVYVAFVIDTFARRIVGWRASRTAHAGFVLDALEQALCERQPVHGGGLVHHSDRGVQYVSIKYTERLAEAGVEPSVGSVGDSYDNALAETINGLYKCRGYLAARAVAQLRSRRVRDPRMGGLVQQQKTAGADRKHSAGRGRSALLCANRGDAPWRRDSNEMASGKPGAVHVPCLT